MHNARSNIFLRQFWIPLLILQLIFPWQLHAQVVTQELALPGEDVIAPKVVHQLQNRGVNPNGTYFFNADVSDDVAVQSVTLFYRTIGDQQYVSSPMTATKPPIYSALLSPQSVRAPGVEYYIQAKDSSGNAVLVGAAFSPLSMAVAPAAAEDGKSVATSQIGAGTSSTVSDEPEEEKKSGINKWWWVAAGVVAVGLIAAAGGGGGGGGGDDDPAPTGGITVTAPLPE
jgi:hypothetical protein